MHLRSMLASPVTAAAVSLLSTGAMAATDCHPIKPAMAGTTITLDVTRSFGAALASTPAAGFYTGATMPS